MDPQAELSVGRPPRHESVRAIRGVGMVGAGSVHLEVHSDTTVLVGHEVRPTVGMVGRARRSGGGCGRPDPARPRSASAADQRFGQPFRGLIEIAECLNSRARVLASTSNRAATTLRDSPAS